MVFKGRRMGPISFQSGRSQLREPHPCPGVGAVLDGLSTHEEQLGSPGCLCPPRPQLLRHEHEPGELKRRDQNGRKADP